MLEEMYLNIKAKQKAMIVPEIDLCDKKKSSQKRYYLNSPQNDHSLLVSEQVCVGQCQHTCRQEYVLNAVRPQVSSKISASWDAEEPGNQAGASEGLQPSDDLFVF